MPTKREINKEMRIQEEYLKMDEMRRNIQYNGKVSDIRKLDNIKLKCKKREEGDKNKIEMKLIFNI